MAKNGKPIAPVSNETERERADRAGQEALRLNQHNRRLLAQIADGWNELPGLRLQKKGSDVGCVVTFDPDTEGLQIVKAIKAVLEARK